jgi:hypothetical protein
MAVAERILREAKASPPKTAALLLVFAVGLYFWIPPVWHALSPSTDTSDSAAAVPQPVTAATTISPAASKPSSQRVLHWQELEQLRGDDELYRSASAADVRTNAFNLSRDYLPLDVELAADEPAPEISTAEKFAEAAADEALSSEQDEIESIARQLSLRSTMIGPNRRAAVINSRVYHEGDVILVDGRRVTLSSVASRRVTMDAGGHQVELRIDPFAASKIRVEQ